MGAAALALLVLRPAASRAPLVRVRPGAPASTHEGHEGVVVDVQGELVLLVVRAGAGDEVAGLWVRRDQLREVERDGLDPWFAGRTIEELRTHLPRLPQPGGLADAPVGRFHLLGRSAYEARTTIVRAAVVCVLVCLPLAATVQGALSSGGFIPDGEAMRVEDDLQGRFRFPPTEVKVLVRGDEATVRRKVGAMKADLLRLDGVAGVGEPETSPDGKAVLVPVGLRSSEDEVTRVAVRQLRATFEEGGLPRMQMAGHAVFSKDVEQQMREDLSKAELIGIPLALAVLLLVFGTVPAAALPIVVGTMSVAVTLAIVHLIGMAVDISVFVLNVSSLLAFGLGIDYSLIAVSRFRTELARGRDVRAATIVTTAQAGRAICVSGVAVLLGLCGLFLIPLGVMRSIAVGGVVVVAVTVAMAALVLPAMLAVLGHRIESMPVRRRREQVDGVDGGWHRLTHAVMRHPGIVLLVVLGAIVAVALPARGARLEVPMQTALPMGVESRVTQRDIERTFERKVAAPMLVVARTDDADEVARLTERLRAVPNVDEVEERASAGGRTLLTVTTERARQGGAEARATAERIRALDAGSSGGPALDVGGQFAWEQEFFDLLEEGMPLVLAVVFGSAFLVLLVAFRSLVVPIKAIVLNVVSITATLGIVVLVFQHGVGAELLGTHQMGWVDASLPLVLFCLLFGLSMDYEVFMLASIAEGWQDGLDTADATAEGIARTAPLVTGGAMILVVLGLAFASTELVLVKQIGFGIAVALLLDATVVRALLVPATMRLLGDWNWWLPSFVARRLPVARWA